jgi:hypothetical protein
MKYTAIAGLISAFTALVAMVIGHLGNHELSWVASHISTFAADAPNDAWITAAMLMSAFSLVCIGVLISRYQILGSSFIVHLLPLMIGAAVSGLILLAAFEETAKSITELKGLRFGFIRQQSFHDAGLMVFFYSSISITMMAGFILAVFRSGGEKILGLILACMGPVSFLLMTTSWPEIIGIAQRSAGLKQRVSFFCIWIAMVMLLLLALKSPLKKDRRILRRL